MQGSGLAVQLRKPADVNDDDGAVYYFDYRGSHDDDGGHNNDNFGHHDFHHRLDVHHRCIHHHHGRLHDNNNLGRLDHTLHHRLDKDPSPRKVRPQDSHETGGLHHLGHCELDDRGGVHYRVRDGGTYAAYYKCSGNGGFLDGNVDLGYCV